MEKEDTTNNKTKNHHVVINIVPPSNAQRAAGKHASDTASSSLSCSGSDASGSFRKNNLVRLQNNLLDEDEEEDVGSSHPTSVDQSGKSLTTRITLIGGQVKEALSLLIKSSMGSSHLPVIISFPR